jgi:hypothetical protein
MPKRKQEESKKNASVKLMKSRQSKASNESSASKMERQMLAMRLNKAIHWKMSKFGIKRSQ